MNFAQRLLSFVGLGRASSPDEPRRFVRASNLYDATQTNDRNARHWQNAQSYAPNAAAGPWARKILRERARYEYANNCYIAGIIKTLADDTVGTGPRLQLRTGDAQVDAQVEEAFQGWCDAAKLGDRIHLMRVQKARDGEGIAVMRSNPALRHEVKLDLWLVEPEQVVDEHISVNGLGFSGMDAEGVELDDFGNPRAYWVLREHPNSIGATVFEPPQRVPAAQVLHYFSPERAGQWRGVSQIAPAIPLCAALRRYTLATVAAAENAANMTMALKSNAMGDADEHNEAAGDILPLEAGGVPLLPAGYELQGIKAEQPVSTYAEFKREVINEIARCLSMPFNVAAADSSSYNYASGRLDHQTYFKSIRVEQKRIIAQILDPLLAAFLREAVLIEGLFTPEVRSKIGRDGALPKHAWFFDGFEHVDPVKEANADDIRLQNGSATLSDLYAKTGQDWQQKVEQRAKELQFIGEMERKYNVVMREPAGARDDNAEPEDRDEPPASNGRGARSRAPARPGASAPGGRRREAAR